MKIKLLFYFIPVFLFTYCAAAQVTLYQSYNGRYDFTFVGNTMNPGENSIIPCLINTSSTESLALNPNDVIENAYLYWAGSGEGDFNVKLNGVDIVPTRTFGLIQITSGYPFFSAFADVTSLVQSTGNGSYTLSELDLTGVISPSMYCDNQTNFAGWAIIVVYKNDNLPLNQLQIYDGLDYVALGHNSLTITLDQLNVIDNEDAKIGFVAWEGDLYIDNGENITLNGEELSNSLNPADNAFNGTNSVTGSTQLYNMDLDIYNIQDYIDIGDTSAEIQLFSQQDFVMINAIVTKLNNQLPDATVAIGDVFLQCNSREMTVGCTVSNFNSTDPLPAMTEVSVYADGQYAGSGFTTMELPIDGSQSLQITITIPDGIPDTFQLIFAVDDTAGTGIGAVTELIENNNTDAASVTLIYAPEVHLLENLVSCNLGFTSALFDFSQYEDLVKTDPSHTVAFYETLANAENAQFPITDASNHLAAATPKEIFVRVDDGTCYGVTSFFLISRNCPPTVYNYISANEDGKNDFFFVDGLRDIFLNFRMKIYNRWGALIWTGDNNSDDWKGAATQGLRMQGNEVPDGTYYFVLDLNDPDYTEPIMGFLYLNR